MELMPLKLHPCYKEYLWGGEQLKKVYGKNDAPNMTAESWELAAHSDGCCTIESGPLKGKTLRDLAKIDHEGYWGMNNSNDEFPIMVKLIDAAKTLSIQVHPSDKTALFSNGEKGKAEMWYIVESKPQAFIYLGFSKRIGRAEFIQRAHEGTICEVLNKVLVEKGDVFYIKPGTIHAIGEGVVVAEIQQNSNTTFRIFDYNRRDADGVLRPLHIGRASEVLNYEPIVPAECRANAKVTFSDFTLTEMFSCEYFKAYQIEVIKEAAFSTDGMSFRHLLCVEGKGKIITGNREFLIEQGQSYFIPAKLGEYRISGRCRILLSLIVEEER